LSSFSLQLELSDGESSGLLDKKDKSAPLSNRPSGGTQNEPLQEESIEVTVDHTGITLSPENGARIRGDHEALNDLLKTDPTSVRAIDEEGNTALHHAVASICQEGNTDERLYQCIDVLMDCKDMTVNMPNKKGYTAIGLAVHHLNRTCVERMLKRTSADRLYLDYYPGDREHTVREIIMETYPDLQPLLKEYAKEDMDLYEGNMKLLAALQHDEYHIFKDNLDSNNPNPSYGEPYHSSLLEIACQMKKRKEFVELLLDSGADPKIKNSVTGMPLIHATARCGNFEVLQLLLEKEGEGLKDNEQRTILHWLARVSERKSRKSLEDCLNRLLQSDCSWKVDTEDRDRWGNTALYIAVERGFRDRAKLLLSKGADVRVFERGSKIFLTASLSLVKEILDDCLLDNDKPLTSKELQLKLDYQSLDNILPHIAESKFHSDLLAHPVMKTFLILKWKNVRLIFILNMVFYVIFLLFLTVYILFSEPHNTLNDGGAASNTTGTFSFNNSNITSGINDSNLTPQLKRRDQFFLWLSLMTLWFLLTLNEIVQMIVHRWVYIQSTENWLEILLIIATFISCSGVVDGMKIKPHFSAVALLLGWFELLLKSGRLPLLSVQQKMFKRVSLTFMSFMAGYVPLLIAFALSFYILFKESAEPEGTKHFPNFILSITKTIVMFSGEYDASELSFDTLPYTSHVIFLLFVVLVAIILLNLLNGLAVNDTGEIRKDAESLSLAARANLISRIERLVNALPKRIKPNIELKKETFVIYPNPQNRIGSSAVQSLLSIIYPNQRNRIGSAAVQSLLSIISEKTKPEGKDKLTIFQKEWRMFAEKLSELQSLHEKLQKKFESMLDE